MREVFKGFFVITKYDEIVEVEFRKLTDLHQTLRRLRGFISFNMLEDDFVECGFIEKDLDCKLKGFSGWRKMYMSPETLYSMCNSLVVAGILKPINIKRTTWDLLKMEEI